MKFFSNLSKTAKIMLLAVIGICLFLLILGLIIIFMLYPFEKPLPFLLGLTAGCIHSMLKVVLLEKSIVRSIGMEEEQQAKNYARLQALARYGLTLAVMLPAILLPGVFGLFGVVSGILSLQLAAYVTNAVQKREGGKTNL